MASVENLSLEEFCKLFISVGTVRQFLEPKYQEIMNRYHMSTSNQIGDTTVIQTTLSDESVVTLKAVALVCVYLSKAGFFKAGTLVSQITREILSNYAFDSVYNKFNIFEKDENRLKKSMIPHIKRAILLLPKYGHDGTVALAKADIGIIEEKIKRAKHQ